MQKNRKFVYFFGGGKAEGKASMRGSLGGKGAGLHEMMRIGIPGPPDSPSPRKFVRIITHMAVVTLNTSRSM